MKVNEGCASEEGMHGWSQEEATEYGRRKEKGRGGRKAEGGKVEGGNGNEGMKEERKQ